MKYIRILFCAWCIPEKNNVTCSTGGNIARHIILIKFPVAHLAATSQCHNTTVGAGDSNKTCIYLNV